MIDAAADVVVGHGPHVLRGIEVYKGRPIFYSLANFIFENDLSPQTAMSFWAWKATHCQVTKVRLLRLDFPRSGCPAPLANRSHNLAGISALAQFIYGWMETIETLPI